MRSNFTLHVKVIRITQNNIFQSLESNEVILSCGI